MSDYGLFSSCEGHKERRTGKIRGAFSRMHRALDGWMLARAPTLPAQRLHHHGRGIPWSKRDTAGYVLIYSVKRTQPISRRPLSPCRVRKTAGYTLPRLLFSRTVLSEMYPGLAGSGTLPSAISPHESLSAPSKGHQNPNLPVLNKQW